MAFKRISNFACVEIRPQVKHIIAHVKINPESITLEPGFTLEVRNIGHYGTGDLEIIIKSSDDLKKAEELISRSYDNS